MIIRTKIFMMKNDEHKELETTMNEWFERTKVVQVVSVTQSSTDYYFDGSKRETVITVLYSDRRGD